MSGYYERLYDTIKKRLWTKVLPNYYRLSLKGYITLLQVLNTRGGVAANLSSEGYRKSTRLVYTIGSTLILPDVDLTVSSMFQIDITFDFVDAETRHLALLLEGVDTGD